MYKASNNMLPVNVQTQFCENNDIHMLWKPENKDKAPGPF